MHLKNSLTKSHTLIFGVLAYILLSCGPLISPFAEQAYQNATSLKAETLALIALSGEPFDDHKDDVADLLVAVDAAYEYANGLPNNKLSARQWDILRDKDRNLLGGFLQRWKTEGQISDYFREEISKLIRQAFDEIICLEINKKTTNSCLNPQ